MGPISHALGHSLGEITALCAVGSLSLEDAISLVVRTFYLFCSLLASTRKSNARSGSKSRYIHVCSSLSTFKPNFRTNIRKATDSATSFFRYLFTHEIANSSKAEGVCQIANINSPLQLVLSGHTKAVESAIERAKTEFSGHKLIAKKLNVSAPFHCSLMEPAAQTVGKVLSSMNINGPSIPLVNNITASEVIKVVFVINCMQVSNPNEIRTLLQTQVTGTVKWLQSIEYCSSVNVKTFVEIGAGKVLSGLLKQIDPSLKCM